MIIENIAVLNETLKRATLVKECAIEILKNDTKLVKDNIALDIDLQNENTCEVQIRCEFGINHSRIHKALKNELSDVTEIYTQVTDRNYYIHVLIENE